MDNLGQNATSFRDGPGSGLTKRKPLRPSKLKPVPCFGVQNQMPNVPSYDVGANAYQPQFRNDAGVAGIASPPPTDKSEVTVKRGRGRPPKSVAVKRGRGRPPKSGGGISGGQTQVADGAGIASPPPTDKSEMTLLKRGRGRPPKSMAVKRGRGRPPKSGGGVSAAVASDPPSDNSQVVVKKRRGRPPKSSGGISSGPTQGQVADGGNVGGDGGGLPLELQIKILTSRVNRLVRSNIGKMGMSKRRRRPPRKYESSNVKRQESVNNKNGDGYMSQSNLDSSNLNPARQSSSPSGFLSSLTVKNGFAGMKGVRKGSSSSSLDNNINFSLGTSSSSRLLPQIAENESELHESTFNNTLKRSRDGALNISQGGLGTAVPVTDPRHVEVDQEWKRKYERIQSKTKEVVSLVKTCIEHGWKDTASRFLQELEDVAGEVNAPSNVETYEPPAAMPQR